MFRPQQAEVLPIQCRKLGLTQPFSYREHRGVDESDVRISILRTKLPDPFEVFVENTFQAVCAFQNVSQEVKTNLRMRTFVYEIVHLRKDWNWNNQFFLSGLKQLTTSSVVGIMSIQGRVKRPSVQD